MLSVLGTRPTEIETYIFVGGEFLEEPLGGAYVLETLSPFGDVFEGEHLSVRRNWLIFKRLTGEMRWLLCRCEIL